MNRQDRCYRLIGAVLLLTFILFALGCVAPAPAQAPPESSAEEEAPEAQAPETVVVGYSPPTLEMTDFYRFGEAGLREKAEELGVDLELVVKAPSTHQAAEDQLRIIEDFITQEVDYIWLVPIAVEAAPPMIRAANEAGIPIIMSHSLEPYEEGLDVFAYVGTDFKETGTLVGGWIAEYLDGEGKVIMLQGDPGFYNESRVNTAVEALEPYPGVEVILGDFTQWDTQKGLNVASTLLEAHPDVDLIYCPSATLTLGAVEAVENAGMTGEIAVVDYDLIPATIKLAKEGKVVAGLGLRPWIYGEEVAQIISDHLAGNPIEQVHNIPGAMSTADEIDEAYPEWYINWGG